MDFYQKYNPPPHLPPVCSPCSQTEWEGGGGVRRGRGGPALISWQRMLNDLRETLTLPAVYHRHCLDAGTRNITTSEGVDNARVCTHTFRHTSCRRPVQLDPCLTSAAQSVTGAIRSGWRPQANRKLLRHCNQEPAPPPGKHRATSGCWPVSQSSRDIEEMKTTT